MAERVIVIGAGIVGAAFAWHLAKASADVLVLEALEQVGGEATPKSWGWINASWGNPEPYFRLRHKSMALWRDWDREVPGLAVNWCGGLLWDLPPDDLLRYANERSAQGYAIRAVNLAEIRRIEPHLTAVPDLAVHAAEEGSVEPLHAVEKIMAAAQTLGADVALATRAKWLVVENGKITGVMTPDGELRADNVVIATGATAGALLRQHGLTLALDEPPGLLVRSQAAPELLKGLVMASELHVRQTPDGQLVAGSDFGGGDPGADVDAAAASLFAKIQALVRGAEHLKLESFTVGYRPTPKDGFPAVGAVPGIAGLYLAVTHSGVTLAPALGKFGAAEMMTGTRDPLLEGYEPGRLITA